MMESSLRGKSKNTHSKKMRALAEKGVTIVCSVAPYEGEIVKFSPQVDCDREPWVLTYIESDSRFSGRDVHALEEKNGDTNPA